MNQLINSYSGEGVINYLVALASEESATWAWPSYVTMEPDWSVISAVARGGGSSRSHRKPLHSLNFSHLSRSSIRPRSFYVVHFKKYGMEYFLKTIGYYFTKFNPDRKKRRIIIVYYTLKCVFIVTHNWSAKNCSVISFGKVKNSFKYTAEKF